MKYKIEIERAALKTLKKINFSDQKKIINAIERLESNPKFRTESC